jgi:hypothetical protein
MDGDCRPTSTGIAVSDGPLGRVIPASELIRWSYSSPLCEKGVVAPVVKSASVPTNGDLRREAVIVLDPAENRKCYGPSRSGQWLLQLGVVVWDPRDRLRRTGPVVTPDVPRIDVTDVIDALAGMSPLAVPPVGDPDAGGADDRSRIPVRSRGRGEDAAAPGVAGWCACAGASRQERPDQAGGVTSVPAFPVTGKPGIPGQRPPLSSVGLRELRL